MSLFTKINDVVIIDIFKDISQRKSSDVFMTVFLKIRTIF